MQASKTVRGKEVDDDGDDGDGDGDDDGDEDTQNVDALRRGGPLARGALRHPAELAEGGRPRASS